MVELPSVKRNRKRVRAWFWDAIAALLSLGLGILAALQKIPDPALNVWAKIGPLVLYFLLFAVVCFKLRMTYSWAARFEPWDEPPELVAWAKGCHAMLSGMAGGLNTGDVRITIHKVLLDTNRQDADWLEQTIRYVGGEGGELGRRTSLRAGVIGRVARTGDIFVAKRSAQSQPEYEAELVEVWGFKRREAAIRASDRCSWMGVPITETDDGPVVGVVYLDSGPLNNPLALSQPGAKLAQGFFGKEANDGTQEHGAGSDRRTDQRSGRPEDRGVLWSVQRAF